MVSKMAEQYKVQLTSAQGSLQSWDLEHKLEVQKLQEKFMLWKYHSLSMELQIFHLLGCLNRHQAVLPSGVRFLTSFWGWSISTGVPHSIVVRIKPFLFRNRCDLSLDQVLILVQPPPQILNYSLSPPHHIKSHSQIKPSM